MEGVVAVPSISSQNAEYELNEISSKMTELNYQQQHSRFSQLISGFVGTKEAFDTVKKEMSEQGLDDVEIEEILSNIERDFFPNDVPDNVSGSDTGWTDYGYSGDERSFEEDIQNGYNDIKELDVNDYFPNGADGPVVKAVGPSGARHGDNPEQKKMQVAETHTELVYAYRKYLNESSVLKKR
jgi:hypothetical protein